MWEAADWDNTFISLCLCLSYPLFLSCCITTAFNHLFVFFPLLSNSLLFFLRGLSGVDSSTPKGSDMVRPAPDKSLCTAFGPLSANRLLVWKSIAPPRCPTTPWLLRSVSQWHPSFAPSIPLPVPSGSQHQEHLAHPGANLSPWLPGSKKKSEGRRRVKER